MHTIASALDLHLAPSMPETGVVGNVVDFPGGGIDAGMQRQKSLVRTVGCLALQGMSASEIAHTLDMDVGIISRMFDDPYVKDIFRREVEARGKFALKKLVAGAAIDVVMMLMHTVNDQMVDIHARLKAGKELLDRGFGKPANAGKFENEGEGFVDGDPELALAKINSQIDELTKQSVKLKAS